MALGLPRMLCRRRYLLPCGIVLIYFVLEARWHRQYLEDEIPGLREWDSTPTGTGRPAPPRAQLATANMAASAPPSSAVSTAPAEFSEDTDRGMMQAHAASANPAVQKPPPPPVLPPPPPPPSPPLPPRGQVSFRVATFYYPWYGSVAGDQKWAHWDHPQLEHWDKNIRERYPHGESTR